MLTDDGGISGGVYNLGVVAVERQSVLDEKLTLCLRGPQRRLTPAALSLFAGRLWMWVGLPPGMAKDLGG